MVHHNPGVGANIGLKDTSAFLDVIRPRKQVKAYVYGHTHTWKIRAGFQRYSFHQSSARGVCVPGRQPFRMGPRNGRR